MTPAEEGSVSQVDLLALDDALLRLGQLSKRQHRIVELRYFAGMTIAETAEVLSLSSATIENEWRVARAWLGDQLAIQ